MASGDGPPAAKKARTTRFYGDRELSDVVLQVHDTDFHVHKMTLACRSIFFKNLFFSEGSKEKKMFVVDEEPLCFLFLVDAVYNRAPCPPPPCKGFTIDRLGSAGGWQFTKVFKGLEEWWDSRQTVIALGEKYGLVYNTKKRLEAHFRIKSCRTLNCIKCTAYSLFALINGFSLAENHRSPKYAAFCLKALPVDVFDLWLPVFTQILDQNAADRQTEVPGAVDSLNASVSEPIVAGFGVPSLSDVTLVIGNYEFKVKKKRLADRSSYFQAMFFSGFKETNEDRIEIEADGHAFQLVMELLHDDEFEDSEFLRCRRVKTLQDAWERVARFWDTMDRIMNTIDFFDFPRQLVHFSLGFFYCRKDTCVECANKKIFALVYDIDYLKEKITSSTETIVLCLKNYPECLPQKLKVSPKDIAALLESLDKKKTEGV